MFLSTKDLSYYNILPLSDNKYAISYMRLSDLYPYTTFIKNGNYN